MKKLKERQKKRQIQISKTLPKKRKRSFSSFIFAEEKWTQSQKYYSLFDIDEEAMQLQAEREKYAEVMAIQSIEGLKVALEHLKNSGFDQESGINRSELFEAFHINFLAELYGLNLYQKDCPDTFNGARLKLFKALCACLLNNSTNEYTDMIVNHIKDAGRKLYEIEGMRGLHDDLVWLFIPKRWQSLVNEAFDGIGYWRA